MTATTTDREAKRSDGRLKAVKAAVAKIPKGVLVCINSSGYATNGSDGASLVFGGVSYEQVDNSAGSAGDKELRLEKTGEFGFVYNGGDATQACVGKEVYIVDNQTVDDDASATTYDIKAGTVVEVPSGALVRVRIDGYAK
jgi:hypothetical protein